MATFGQGINPQLGAINYGAYQQGANQGSSAIGQGIASLGQDLAQGIKQYQQNKLMAGQATAEFEAAAMQSPKLLSTISAPNAPPEVAKAFKKLQKDGAVGLKDAAVLSTYAKTFITGEQRQKQAEMEMEKLRIDQANAVSERMRAEAARTTAEREKAPPMGRIMTQEEINKIPKGTDFRAAPLPDGNFFVSQMGPFGPGATTNINTGDVGNARGIFETMKESLDTATKAQNSFEALSEAKAILDEGKAFTGSLAEQRLALAKVGNLFGIPDDKTINTEVMRSRVGVAVASYVKNFGSGNGITEKDVEFSKDIVGGKIGLNEGTLKRLTDIGLRAAKNIIQRHNDVVNEIYPETDASNKAARSLFKLRSYNMDPVAPPAIPAIPKISDLRSAADSILNK